MIRTNITMVHAAKIASLGFPGCKTVQSVANFCQKNKSSINCVWWKKQNQKVLLVDPQSFKQCYKQVINTTSTTGKGTRGRKITTRSRTNARRGGRRITRRKRTY